jgi:hypothetical protein
MSRHGGIGVLHDAEKALRERVEHAYAEARRLVFDVVQGPVDGTALTPRQASVLREFHEAEAALCSWRDEQRARIEGSRDN